MNMLEIKIFTFNPVEENTYLLYNQHKDCIIIDPGCYFEHERKMLKDFISDNGLTPKILLNTHCHFDHVFGNKFINETYGLELHIHPKEQILLEYAPKSAENYNISFQNYQGPLHFLNEGDIVTLGTDELKVLFTPGHAPGHIAFYCEKQGFVIDGDVLFKNSVGRTDIPFGDFDVLINSIRTRLLVLPDEVVIYPGHGDKTTIGNEKRDNPFLSIS